MEMLVEQLGLQEAKVVSVPMSKEGLANEDIYRELSDDNGKPGGSGDGRAGEEDGVPDSHGRRRPKKEESGFSMVDSFSRCGRECGDKGCRDHGGKGGSTSGKQDFLATPAVSSGFRRLKVVEAEESDSEDEGWIDVVAGEAEPKHAKAQAEPKHAKAQEERVQGLTQRMAARGWTELESGKWVQEFWCSDRMIDVEEAGLKRRTTRDTNTGVIIEDLWVEASTPERIRKRALRKAKDLQVVVEIEDAGESGGKPEDNAMDPEEASKYRAATARMNFLAQGRPDIQFVSKECSRRMAQPQKDDWQLLKKAVRYLKGNPRLV